MYRYDEIRNLYVERLGFVWMEDSTAAMTRASVKTKIKHFAKGDLEHATEMLSALWGTANGDKEVEAHPGPLADIGMERVEEYEEICPSEDYRSPTRDPAYLASANVALIKSVRKGVFFDRRYWARHSKAGDMLKPVYFSSTTMKCMMERLNECASNSFRRYVS